MALLYLDTSALVKLYITERGSERMEELALSDANDSLATCAITQVEFHSAVDRRLRLGDLDEYETERAVERFTDHFKDSFFLYPVDNRILDLACVLVHRRSLRAYDAVQLAACLLLRRLSTRETITFISADRNLLTAAQAEGLAVLNPES